MLKAAASLLATLFAGVALAQAPAGTAEVTADGCKLYLPQSEAKGASRIRWSGQCANGLAEGRGVVRVYSGGKISVVAERSFAAGKIASGGESYSLRSGEVIRNRGGDQLQIAASELPTWALELAMLVEDRPVRAPAKPAPTKSVDRAAEEQKAAAEKAKQAEAKAEKDRAAAEAKAAADKLAAEKAAQEAERKRVQAEKDRAAADAKAAAQRSAAAEKLAAQKAAQAEKERAAAERAVADAKAAAEKQAAEKVAQEAERQRQQAEKERAAAEAQAAGEKLAADKAAQEAERQRQQADKERAAADAKAAADKLAAEKAAQEGAERQRVAAAKAAAERPRFLYAPGRGFAEATGASGAPLRAAVTFKLTSETGQDYGVATFVAGRGEADLRQNAEALAAMYERSSPLKARLLATAELGATCNGPGYVVEARVTYPSAKSYGWYAGCMGEGLEQAAKNMQQLEDQMHRDYKASATSFWAYQYLIVGYVDDKNFRGRDQYERVAQSNMMAPGRVMVLTSPQQWAECTGIVNKDPKLKDKLGCLREAVDKLKTTLGLP